MICRLRLDLFRVIPQIETNTCGLEPPLPDASALFRVTFYAVDLMFQTYFTEKGLVTAYARSSNSPAPVAFLGRFVVVCASVCVYTFSSRRL